MSAITKNVFISHVHEDDDGLGKLKSLLDKNGMAIRDYSINSDNPNNAHSEDYIKSEILAPRIRDSGTMVVYVSEKTKESHYVNWEIEYAHKLGKPIVGVWAQGEHGCELPEALDDYGNAVVGWHGNSIIDAILGKKDDWEGPDGNAFPRRKIDRHNC